MRRTLLLLRRELLSTFVSPVSWIILVLFLLVMGANMYLSILAVQGDLRQLLTSSYGGLVFWFMFLVIPPLVTMRSLAEEQRQGALEVLLITGISAMGIFHQCKGAAVLTGFHQGLGIADNGLSVIVVGLVFLFPVVEFLLMADGVGVEGVRVFQMTGTTAKACRYGKHNQEDFCFTLHHGACFIIDRIHGFTST